MYIPLIIIVMSYLLSPHEYEIIKLVFQTSQGNELVGDSN